jgi:hypothetical protein
VALERVEAYTAELRQLAGELEGRLGLLAGLEINFSLIQTDLSFLSRLEPKNNPLNKLDFVLFEYVNDAEWFGLGIEELLRIRPFLSLPVGLAHNDLDRNFSGAVEPATLALLLARSDVFVELCPTRRNSRPQPSGSEAWLPYYRVESPFMSRFWQAARAEGLLLSIGCDAHESLEDVARVEDAARFLEQMGLEQQTVLTRWEQP